MTDRICPKCDEVMWKIGKVGYKNGRHMQRYKCNICGITCQYPSEDPVYLEVEE